MNTLLLTKIKFNISNESDLSKYPFSIPLIKDLKEIDLKSKVTFLVGENGSGKSTILNAIACEAGFGPEGGSKNMFFKTAEDKVHSPAEELAEHITLSWRHKPKNGYFFRAESFFNVANYLDNISKDGYAFSSYGDKSLHAQSHGESFWSLFSNRLGSNGFFIFDEPEAALSPQRQLSLLRLMHEICKHPDSQFIIATHSPILLAFPNATIYDCDNNLSETSFEDTQHFRVTKSFLDNPKYFLNLLFEE